MEVYNKLVRDKIVDIINNNGRDEVAVYRILDDNELKIELLKKLEEEFIELKEAIIYGDNNSIVEESADLIEVIRAINNNDLDCVISKLEQKREKRGGFSKKIFLEKVLKKNNDFL